MIVLAKGRIIPSYKNVTLTHFMSLVFCYTPRKDQKTSDFLMISGGIGRDQWQEMN